MRRHRPDGSAAIIATLIAAAACSGGGPTVPPPTQRIAAIQITPDPLDLLVSESGTVTAIALDSIGNRMPSVTFTWSIANTGIASVNTSGLVTGVSPGTTSVTAKSGNTTGQGTVNVRQLSPLRMEIQPDIDSVMVGGTLQYSVVVRDGSGAIIAPPPPVTWSSSDTHVATIDANGKATGLATGYALIDAHGATLSADFPAFLGVYTGLCGNIMQVPAFSSTFHINWAQGTTVNGLLIQAEHAMDIQVDLVMTTPGIPHWEANPAGTGKINDSETEKNPPGRKATIVGAGNLPPASNGLGPVLALDVDLTNCWYRFNGTPWLKDVDYTDFSGATQTYPSAIGTFNSGWLDIPLHWRTSGGLSDNTNLTGFPAHSVLWLVSDTANVNSASYIPSGYGALMWGAQAGKGEAALGLASTNWIIIPK